MYYPKRGDRITCLNGHHVLTCVEDCTTGVVRSQWFVHSDGSEVEPYSVFEGCPVSGCDAPWFRSPLAMHVEGKGWTNEVLN